MTAQARQNSRIHGGCKQSILSKYYALDRSSELVASRFLKNAARADPMRECMHAEMAHGTAVSGSAKWTAARTAPCARNGVMSTVRSLVCFRSVQSRMARNSKRHALKDVDTRVVNEEKVR
jgi:hypothetical protein